MSDDLRIFSDTYSAVDGFKATGIGSLIKRYTRYKNSKKIADPIRFFDYDGTVVATYSSVPSSLPAVPTHIGLKNGTWNYNLQQIQTQFNAMGSCDIGANYMTVSEKTEIDVEFADAARLSPYLRLAVNGTVTVDWGDGSSTEDVTGTSLTSRQDVQHTYSSAGRYTITLAAISGSYSMYSGSSANSLLHANNSTGNANRVYSNCVKAVRIGASCGIGDTAFAACYSLSSVTIPSGVTSIGNNVFYNCFSLSSVTIPSGVTSIGVNAFYGCFALSSVTIPSGVMSIGNASFSNCYSLSSVTIPSGVMSIGNASFSNCYSLSSITIPSGVTSIGANVFAGCYALSSITIPSGVTSINTGAFQSCYSLSSVTIPSGVTSIGNSAFNSCYSLSSVTIPSGVTSINGSTFQNCFSLSSVTIPSGVTSIDNSAFNACYSLSSVTIPSGVTSIGNSAFNACYSLSSIAIPSSVTSIGNSAFSGCYGMKEYHFERTTPPTLGTTAFSNIQSDCIIYVPRGKLNDYESTTNWSDYASYMQEEPA